MFRAHDAVGDQRIVGEPGEQLEYPREIRSDPVGFEFPTGKLLFIAPAAVPRSFPRDRSRWTA